MSGIPIDIMRERGEARVLPKHVEAFIVSRNGIILGTSEDGTRAHCNVTGPSHYTWHEVRVGQVQNCFVGYMMESSAPVSGYAVFRGAGAESLARACENYAEQQP